MLQMKRVCERIEKNAGFFDKWSVWDELTVFGGFGDLLEGPMARRPELPKN